MNKVFLMMIFSIHKLELEILYKVNNYWVIELMIVGWDFYLVEYRSLKNILIKIWLVILLYWYVFYLNWGIKFLLFDYVSMLIYCLKFVGSYIKIYNFKFNF